MTDTASTFINGLIGVRDWSRQNTQIREWAAAGRTDLLREIADRVSSPGCPSGVEPLVRQSMLEGIFTSLALTPAEATAAAALCCAPLADRLAPPYHSGRWPGHFASMLAAGQTHETLGRLFARFGNAAEHRELLACLVQETLLRTSAVPSTAVRFWEQQVVAGNHPLARLPLRLLSQEGMLARFLPQYWSDGGASWSPPYLERSPDAKVAGCPPSDAEVRWSRVGVSEEERSSISAALQNWAEESNGILEVGLFRADRQVTLSRKTLLSLPMDCVNRASEGDVTAKSVALSEALSQLFSAAANGGAYSHGRFGAYGRLAAWRSAAALVGVSEGTGVNEVAAAAEQCPWLAFDANNDWFQHVAWDLGLAVLRPDGRTLAVLAATDTD